MQTKSRVANPAALLFLSGAAALAHQTFWTRRLVDLLGASTHTFSQVVGAFFLGLALGAGWATIRSTRCQANWGNVASAELAVGLLALPCLLSIYASDWLPSLITRWHLWKGLLCLVLILPASFAMGLILPWTLQALSSAGRSAPHQVVWLYTLNTLGGLAGIAFIVASAQLQLGLQWIGLATVVANLLVAGGFLRLAHRHPADASENPPPTSGASQNPILHPKVASGRMERASAPLLAVASGFLVLGLEVLMQHQFAQVTINSFFSSAIVLSLVLAGLAIGGVILPRIGTPVGATGRPVRIGLIAAASACLLQPFLFKIVHPGLASLPYEWPPLLYLLGVLGLGAIVVLPLFIASGLLFPALLQHAARSDLSPRAAGRRTASLLMLNGLGGWVGAEMTVNWILPEWGLWQSVVLIGGIYTLLLAVIGSVNSEAGPSNSPRWTHRTTTWVVSLTLLGLVGLAWSPAGHLPQVALGPRESLVALRVDREGVVACVQVGPDDKRILFNNTYTLGGSKAQANQERQGLLPVLLHGRGGDVALLGVATGSTTAGAALSPSVHHLEAIELSARVLEFARSEFTPFNRSIFQDPRARFIHDDARWVISARTAAYDIVVGDLFLPWRTGEGRLFTQEHFRSVKASLKPEGLFCQWLPLFQLTREQFDLITRTFRSVFPDSFVVRGDFYTELPIVGLVGGRRLEELDWVRIAQRCEELRQEGKTRDPLLRHPEGVAMLLLGPLDSPAVPPFNTLANARLEWAASRQIIGLKDPWFVGIPCAERLKNLHRAGQRLLPESLRAAHDSGQFFLTLEIAAKVNSPVFENLKAQSWDRLPQPLQTDVKADWERWPMRVKPQTKN